MDALVSLIGVDATAATPWWLALMLGIAAASATLIGWALAAMRRQWSVSMQGVLVAAAAVAMITLTVLELLPEAYALMPSLPLIAAALLGGGVIAVGISRIGHRLSSNASALGRTGAVVAVVIGLHNIPEGAIPVGMSMVSVQAAVMTAVVIGLHNIPEGLAIAAPVLADGASRRKAFAFVGIATLGEIAGVSLATGFSASVSGPGVAVLLAVVGGIMLTVSVVELLPSGLGLIRDGVRARRVSALQPAIAG